MDQILGTPLDFSPTGSGQGSIGGIGVVPASLLVRGEWRNGRRAGFRCQCP